MASVQETRWDWKIFGNLGWWGGERPHTNSVVGFNAQFFTMKKKYNWFTVLCFRCAVKWFSYTHIHILFQILFHYRLLQDTERRYLCRRALLLTISYVCVCWSLRHVWLFAIPWTVAHQAHPSMGFSRQEYWNGLPFPSPGDLPHPGIERWSPALQVDSLTSEPPGKPHFIYSDVYFLIPNS